MSETLELKAGKKWLVGTSMTHVGGSRLGTFPSLSVGGCVIILKCFAPKAYLQAINNHKPERGFLIPSLILDLLADPGVESTDFSSMLWLGSGGDATPDDIHEKWHKQTEGKLACFIGMTECDSYCIQTQPISQWAHGSMGKARVGVEISIANSKGSPMQPQQTDEVGEILVRSNSILQGYWNDLDRSKETIVNGWLHTGDTGYLDRNGELWVVGRLKEMIIRCDQTFRQLR